ncbi:hypothetical protein [Flavobacterium alkalisoli]|uniref:hypothetical protein n=1 Tax=Flavobacterium alkalisoli TaxID=2602769 RepID=UPI003A90DD91
MKRYLYLLPLLFLATIISCSTNQSIAGKRPAKHMFYFPLNTAKHDPNHPWGVENKLDSFTNTWYSKHLHTLKEPILYNLENDSIEIYRYTHLGTWSHPYVIRIEKTKTSTTITLKNSTGLGGYQTGHLKVNNKFSLRETEFEKIKQKLHDIKFDTITTHASSGLDGEECIIEVLSNGEYKFVNRWSPYNNEVERNKEFVELIELFHTTFNDTAKL